MRRGDEMIRGDEMRLQYEITREVMQLHRLYIFLQKFIFKKSNYKYNYSFQ